MYKNTIVHNYLSAIVNSLQKENLRALCDGSFDSGHGTAAWCINGNGIILRGVNIAPIGSDTLDAIRCKLAGIYSILRIIEYIIAYYKYRQSTCGSGL